jgi:hypothetical protein
MGSYGASAGYAVGCLQILVAIFELDADIETTQANLRAAQTSGSMTRPSKCCSTHLHRCATSPSSKPSPRPQSPSSDRAQIARSGVILRAPIGSYVRVTTAGSEAFEAAPTIRPASTGAQATRSVAGLSDKRRLVAGSLSRCLVRRE